MEVNVRKLKIEMKRASFSGSRELADRLGMTRQAIDYILRRKTTTFKTISKIADVFGLDGKDLIK
jgi:transcriptional regulator with XRE-family HTH domain